ncbi:AraC family transcriptional regulator [Bacillus sp. SD088]|uniref:AraC family transcriptional regulator n=1 Tax=Bacillus sp. SD088 TaxID=2782012 RepID=UPI001A9676E2|nr:AraC family transcriptional regulator [Bacillus sp. SD088]MBO0992022.1 helix-turn-helix transcriptional regulator [Bacillus sp. SD088]
MKDSITLPKLIRHVFWNKKKHFLRKQDTYSMWMLFAIEEGDFTYQIDKSAGHAKKGDIVFCPPRVAFHRKTETPLSFHAIVFDFPYHETGFLQEMLRQNEHKLFVPLTTRLFENYQQLRKLHPLSDVVPLKQIYFHDMWIIMSNYNPPVFERKGQKHQDDPVMKQVLAHLENHAHQPIEIKRVASKFHMSSVQLTRRFKNVYHMTPMQYLTSIRIEKAANLLLETNWNLETIAHESGYESGYYLSRIFHKHMNVRPSDYRKINRF